MVIYFIFSPKIPSKWEKYSFTIVVKGNILKVEVSKNKAIFKLINDSCINVDICGKNYTVTKEGVEIEY